MESRDTKKDQRYIPRWEVSNRVLYHVQDEKSQGEARTRDLSCAGLCIRTDGDLLSDKKIELTIYLSQKRTIRVQGRILWTRKTSEGSLAGIIFDNIQPEDQDLILDYAFAVKKDDLVKHWFKGWDGDQAPPSSA